MEDNYREALRLIQLAKENQSQVKMLALSDLGLTQFPAEIFELHHLTELNLGGNKLSFIPDDIEHLTSLEQLILYENELTRLPKSLGKLSNLFKLDITENKFLKIPECIETLSSLTTLYLGYNQLSSIPKSIGGLSQLTHLSLNNNKLLKVPSCLRKLKKLTVLEISNNGISTIPFWIGELIQLRRLGLSSNQLQTIPDNLRRLKDLTELSLTRNNFTSIPDWIGNFSELLVLGLGGNHISTIPNSIENLKKLGLLYLWGNPLGHISDKITSLPNLTHLEASEIGIKNLPESIGKLTKLSSLDLSDNQLTTIPGEIQELTSLKRLSLNNNAFKVGIEVYGLPPHEQIQQILNWQRAEQEGTLQPINEAKVIFIGESNYGKTHIIEFLQQGKINRKIKTTHGIERSQITISHEIKNIRLNIWDLGGQEFMRSTHQFFFSERTLYVLVTLARRERNELNHWLKLANQLGNKAPVLVVINKVDMDPHDLDRKSLERDYPNIVGFVRTSINNCKEGKASETLERLKEAIIETVTDKQLMPSVFEERPPQWFAVKKELEDLEAKGTDFITYERYESLQFIKDLPENERKINLKLLSMIGAVVSFVDDPRLLDTNVINPQWIMDGVYAIINDSKVKDEYKGQLHVGELERILHQKRFPKARHAYLLELMKKFNLCYAAKDQPDIYFIPDLFEDVEPDFDWNSADSMHFRYNYDDFVPSSFMTRFIVEMHQDIMDEKRWRSGVYISNGSCQAKVYQSYRKNYIHVEVQGNKGEGRSYLYTIRETFRKLHKPFPQMKIKQDVQFKDHWIDYLRLVKLEEKNKPWYHDELDEDLPITDILNGYSTPIDREGSQLHLKIFLASSAELKAEREQFEIFIHRENQKLYKEGIFIELILWENFIDAISRSRLQDEYNNAVKQCDIFVSLFFTKVGKFTAEEFETAFGHFKENGYPFVYTYFKNAPIDTESITDEIKSLLAFREKLKDLGHFRTVYKNVEDLKLQFKQQLDMLLPTIKMK